MENDRKESAEKVSLGFEKTAEPRGEESHHIQDGSNHHVQDEFDYDMRETAEDKERKQKVLTLLSNRDRGIFFKDGKRKIDFILTYDAEDDSQTTDVGTQQKSPLIKKLWRRRFISNLKKLGLQIEREMVVTTKKRVVFVKVYASFDVLCLYGELLRVKLPFAFSENKSKNWTNSVLQTVFIPNAMWENVPLNPPHQYSCEFRRAKLKRFLHYKDPECIFLTRTRNYIVNSILQSVTYGKHSHQELGINRLLKEEVFTSAFPLHDGPYKPELHVDPNTYNQRQILRRYWANWHKWYKYQPLDHIRDYFGEKIAIYFAWLGFYTAWLHLPAIVGLFVFVYGITTTGSDVATKEICDSGEEYRMCPLCDGCPYFFLSNQCTFYTISGIFDNISTIAYAMFLSLWSVLFLEFWKRTNASLSYQWDVFDYEKHEPPRAEFTVNCTQIEKNPITGEPEPHFPARKRYTRMVTGITVLILMVSVVIIAIVGVTVYRSVMTGFVGGYPHLRSFSMTIASISATCLHLIVIVVLGQFYQLLAYRFTEWEMHRTKTEFEDHYIFKVFLFQFVNYYSAIFYAAFFKGRFVGYPGNYNTVLGFRMEECMYGGCLMEVVQQLVIFMIVKQLISNAKELIMPKVKRYLHKKKMGAITGNVDLIAPWEVEFELISDEGGLFEEYLEMIIQYGFLTFFVAAFPLAPIFALLNNYIEIRLDATKYVTELRRPVGEQAQDIGVWFHILHSISQLAVLTNAFLIAFTTEVLPKLQYRYKNGNSLVGYTNFSLAHAPDGTFAQPCRYRDYRDESGSYTTFHWELLVARLGFVIVFEHIVFGISNFVAFLVPDVPEEVHLNLEREKFLSHEIMADVHIQDLIRKKHEDEEDVHDRDEHESERLLKIPDEDDSLNTYSVA